MAGAESWETNSVQECLVWHSSARMHGIIIRARPIMTTMMFSHLGQKRAWDTPAPLLWCVLIKQNNDYCSYCVNRWFFRVRHVSSRLWKIIKSVRTSRRPLFFSFKVDYDWTGCFKPDKRSRHQLRRFFIIANKKAHYICVSRLSSFSGIVVFCCLFKALLWEHYMPRV